MMTTTTSNRKGKLRRRERRDAYLLLTPTTVILLVIVILPVLAALVLAFTDLKLIEIRHLTPGTLELTLKSFAEVLSSRSSWVVIATTVAYALVSSVGSVVVGAMVALALRKPFKGISLVRAAVLIPYVLPVVASTTIWKALLHPQSGPINALGTQYLGWTEPINFLTTKSVDLAGIPIPMALSFVIAFSIWKNFPLAFLFFTARLQAVAKEQEEAATVDGAAPTQVFRFVLWPEMVGVAMLLFILRFIWTFQDFNDIYLLTGGVAGTQVLPVRVYEELVTRNSVSGAAANGMVIVAVLILPLVAYVWETFRREKK